MGVRCHISILILLFYIAFVLIAWDDMFGYVAQLNTPGAAVLGVILVGLATCFSAVEGFFVLLAVAATGVANYRAMMRLPDYDRAPYFTATTRDFMRPGGPKVWPYSPGSDMGTNTVPGAH